MVKKITLHKFVRKNGYELVEKFGIHQTSRTIKISRPTIYAILKAYPEPPKRTIPKYTFEWERTLGYQLFKEKHEGKLRTYDDYINKGMRAFKFLNKKDPISWELEDFRKIWHAEEFKDELTRKISFDNAIRFRKWMRAMGKSDFCVLEEFTTRNLKRPKGARKQWYLEDDEISDFIENCEYHDVLMAFVVDLLCGGRASSIMPSKDSHGINSHGIRPMDIDVQHHSILMFEPKREQYLLRLFHPKLIQLLQAYITEYNIAPNKSCFMPYNTMRRWFKETTQKARIEKLSDMRGAWHIVKHTFVTQGAFHGLSMEVISQQTGTDPNTLMECYAGIKEKKLRHELLGEQADIEPFHEWAERVIIEPATKRYETISNGGDKLKWVSIT